MRIDHVTIAKDDLNPTVAFYHAVLGLVTGPRPAFPDLGKATRLDPFSDRALTGSAPTALAHPRSVRHRLALRCMKGCRAKQPAMEGHRIAPELLPQALPPLPALAPRNCIQTRGGPNLRLRRRRGSSAPRSRGRRAFPFAEDGRPLVRAAPAASPGTASGYGARPQPGQPKERNAAST